MTENIPADDRNDEQQPQQSTPNAQHVDPTTLRSAYAFDGSGPYLYAPDGSGPYTYTHDGRGPFLVGSAAAQSRTTDQGAGYGNAGYGAAGYNSPYGTAGHPAYGAGHPAYATANAFGPAAGTRHPRRRRIGLMIGSGVAALAILGAAGGTALGLATRPGETTTSSGSSSGSTLPGQGTYGSNGTGSGSSGSSGSGSSGSTGTGTTSGQTAATDSQKAGLVTIVSELDYSSDEEAAGTGMIISSDGEILTNNHVIEDATSIKVTVQSTGKTYTADVVGEDKTDDVAVLKLENASGLTTVTTDTDGVSVGDDITDVGNAEGGGTLVAAAGTVTATNQSITVQSDSGDGTESLSGLIEVSADVVSGDSGGPILDSDGEVVGMATAASSGTTDVTGYAIPIATAKSIAAKILAGDASSTITIGLPAFLGVEVSSESTSQGTSGVAIAGTVTDSPAAKAGLAEGDTITAIDGTAVTSADQMTSIIQSHSVGDSITVTYTTSTGTSATATVTLVSGPAN
jgi:S1-C subfamily serine protease